MKLISIFLLFSLISCAKISYMAEQGIGQVALEIKGKKNEKVLKDPDVKDEHKRKIKLVQKAKKYFFKYYGFKENSIYDQTTFLENEAVSYLVIHSPHDRIRAKRTCFPIAGCFPYLGFFNKESAIKFKKGREKNGYHTFMRPVYAYSTLNHPLIPFSDNILSSFFQYKDEQLIALIFHELIHTILYVKNEGKFNENLAEFISIKMLEEYLNWDQDYKDKRKAKIEMSKKLGQKVVSLTKELKNQYKKRENKPEFILRNFLANQFKPSIKAFCMEKNISPRRCWPLKVKWNNARFAAFGTYEEKQNEIELIYKKMNLPLKEFVLKLIELEDDFDGDSKFLDYLKQKS